MITPFWERLPGFFKYPRHMASLIHIGISCVLMTISFSVGLFGIALFVIGLFIVLKYAYSVLQHTADGFLTPPESINNSAQITLAIKQLAAFMWGMFLVGGVTKHIGEAFGIIAFVLVELWLPASCMIIAVSHSLVKAINPIFFIDFIRRIGWPYLLLWAFLSLLSVSSVQSFEILSHFILVEVNTLLFTFLLCYFLIIMFHMLGYVVFQYHEQLGYSVNNAALKDYKRNQLTAEQGPVFSEFDEQVNELLYVGDYESAVQKLLLKTKHEPINHAQQERLIKLLANLDAPKLLCEVVEGYFRVLVDLGEMRLLVKHLAQISPAIKEYSFQSTQLLYKLTIIAQEARLYDAVVNLSASLRKLAPNNVNVPAAGLLEAKVLCEHKHDDKAAATLMTSLINTFPEHPAMQEMKDYQQFITQLATAKY